MRQDFPGYFDPTAEDISALWKDAVIALDTNVLLGLYRWPASTRQEIFRLLELIAPRLWVPYHVLVEYHRNRLEAMRTEHKAAQQLERDFRGAYEAFKAVVSSDGVKDRACWPDLSKKLGDTSEHIKELLTIAKAESNNYISPNSEDHVLAFLEKLLPGRCGARPESQEEVDAAEQEAARRFAVKMGPGYLDGEKAGDKYMFDGLVYDRQYGDFMVWRELLAHCSVNQISNLLLITSDVKGDWWLDSKSVSGKRPQPELVMEMSRRGGVDKFWMYTLSEFLAKSDRHLQVKVTQKAITDVRQAETSSERELKTRLEKVLPRLISTADMKRVLAALEAKEFEANQSYVSGAQARPSGKPLGVVVISADNLLGSIDKMKEQVKLALEGLDLLDTHTEIDVFLLFARRPVDSWLKRGGQMLAVVTGELSNDQSMVAPFLAYFGDPARTDMHFATVAGHQL